VNSGDWGKPEGREMSTGPRQPASVSAPSPCHARKAYLRFEGCSGPACSLATKPHRVWKSEMIRITGIRPTSYTLGSQRCAPPAPYRFHAVLCTPYRAVHSIPLISPSCILHPSHHYLSSTPSLSTSKPRNLSCSAFDSLCVSVRSRLL
jgi:hypothetical protein